MHTCYKLCFNLIIGSKKYAQISDSIKLRRYIGIWRTFDTYNSFFYGSPLEEILSSDIPKNNFKANKQKE